MSELQPIAIERKSKLAQVRVLVNSEQDRGMLFVIGETKIPSDRELLDEPLDVGQNVQAIIYVAPKNSLYDLNKLNHFTDGLARSMLALVDGENYYNDHGKIEKKSGGLLIPQIKMYEKAATTDQLNITATTALIDDFIEPVEDMGRAEREQLQGLGEEVTELINETGTVFATMRETAVYVYPTERSARKAYEYVNAKQRWDEDEQGEWDEEVAADSLKKDFTGSVFGQMDNVVPILVKVPQITN
jgi:hypothetical protein